MPDMDPNCLHGDGIPEKNFSKTFSLKKSAELSHNFFPACKEFKIRTNLPMIKFQCTISEPLLFIGNDVFSKHLFPMVSYTQNTHKFPIPSNPRSTLLPSPLPRPLQPV